MLVVVEIVCADGIVRLIGIAHKLHRITNVEDASESDINLSALHGPPEIVSLESYRRRYRIGAPTQDRAPDRSAQAGATELGRVEDPREAPETGRLDSADNPFAAKVLPMSPV